MKDLAIVKFEGEYANAVHTKNLLMRDGKKKDRLWLVIAAIDTEINLKALGKQLKVASGKFSFASE